ncbi:MAG: DUF99 family protein [Candidatus Bathyarchaeia archaeon]
MSRNVFHDLQVVGVEDGSFQKGLSKNALLVLVLFHGLELKDIKVTKITVDGLDATKKFGKVLSHWNFDVVTLAGVSFAGFNIIDPTIINKKFGKPIIVVSRTKPNNDAVKRALQRHFEDWKIRWKTFENLGTAHELATKAGRPPVYIEVVGAEVDWAFKIIKALSVCSRVPEPLRVARLIARGLS